MLVGGYQRAKVLKDYEIEESKIQALRKRIIYEEKLHKGDLKSYSELLVYYNKYYIPLMENDFFERVLDVKSFCLKNIKSKNLSKEISEGGNFEEGQNEEKERKTGVIKNEIITEEEIENFREKVLKEELLHKDDKISYSRFLEIYNKHFIPLSEEEFAKRILDDYKGYPKEKKALGEYIAICMQDVISGEDYAIDIDTLEESILSLDKDDDNIKFFTRYCISKGEYKRANGFLAYYIGDYSVKESDKKPLKELYEEIKSARQRRNVIESALASNKTNHTENNYGEMKKAKTEINRNISRILKTIEF